MYLLVCNFLLFTKYSSLATYYYWNSISENLREKKKTEEIRQKLEERKEKRKIEQRLASVKTIAETATEEDDDASTWVERSRKLQQAKDEAQKRAKMLEEMDQAFGVGDIIDMELSKAKARAYTGKDLQGLRVEHDRVSKKHPVNLIRAQKNLTMFRCF